ncbi:MAG: 50S ribosomal protein L18 [Candidatus Bathyarchaeia archaeon]
MASGSTYNLPFRRRREQKTDYRKRRAYIVSGKPRMVARPTEKNITVQIVEAAAQGDRVIASANSKELSRYGWTAGRGNLPTAYLTGFLAGLRSVRKGVKEAILDIGLRKATKGSRIFAALKGGLDAGLAIPHSAEMLPDDARVSGGHIAEYARLLSNDQEAARIVFTQYRKSGLQPEDVPALFQKVKEKISEHPEGLG